MRLAQALQARNKVAQGLARKLARALTPFLGRDLSQDVVDEMRASSQPSVQAARSALEKLARVQYLGLLRKTEKPVSAAKLVRFTPDAWTGSLDKVIGEAKTLDEDTLSEVLRKGDWWARDGERGALIDYSIRDKRFERWARVDPEPPTCPFCTVLISRGAVYKGQDKVLANFHTGDTCVPTLVRKGEEDTYEGVDLRDKALAEYQKAVEATGGNTGISSVIKAMKENRAQAGEGSTARTTDQAAKTATAQAVSQQSAKLSQAEARRATLDRINPKNDAQSKYRDKQVAKEDKLIRELSQQLGTLKGS